MVNALVPTISGKTRMSIYLTTFNAFWNNSCSILQN